MDRVGRKVSSFEEARRLEVAEYHAMSWQERWDIALELQRRVFGDDVPDLREGAATPEGRARKFRRAPARTVRSAAAPHGASDAGEEHAEPGVRARIVEPR